MRFFNLIRQDSFFSINSNRRPFYVLIKILFDDNNLFISDLQLLQAIA